MTRTIKENLLQRLIVQAEEAELQGLSKVSQALTDQIELHATRPDNEKYSYSQAQLKNDLTKYLWSGAIRVADYYNKPFDAAEMHDLVSKYADAMAKDIAIKIGGTTGAYDSLPGEIKETVEIEVE